MRVIAAIVTVVGSTTLMVLGILGIVRLAERTEPWMLLMCAAGVALALMGPMLLGSLAAWYDVRGGSDSGRHFKQWRIAVVIGTVLGAGLVLTGGIASSVPVWLLAVLLTVAVGLLLLAVPVGERVRRSADSNRPHEPEASADGSAETRQVVRRSALAFVITLAVSVVIWLVLASVVDEFGLDSRFALTLAPLPFMVAAIVCSLQSFRFARRTRELAGHDLGRLRTIARVVLKGADDELDHEGEVAAAKYATLVSSLLGTQLGFPCSSVPRWACSSPHKR